MTKIVMILTIVFCSVTAWTQQNIVTLSGGYVFTNVEETDVSATGWRINGLYEFNPFEGMISHGISFGYINTKAEYINSLQTSNYTLQTLPVYYAPKIMVGNAKIKGFLKGALGMHFSKYERTGSLLEITSNDLGFYGGASLGGMFFLSPKMFINVEYEWAFLSNSYYKNGFVNSVMGGIGIKL